MNWETLIAISRILADFPDGPDSESQLRLNRLNKAVSATYYAMFHALAQSNADTLVGDTEAARGTDAWYRTYRALEHRTAYRQMSESRLSNFSDVVKDFGDKFRALQEHRHRADYDPWSQFPRTEILNIVTETESVISGFLAASIGERRDFAAHVLFPSRT